MLYRRLIRWLETLRITQGAAAGESWQLLPWQRQFIKGVFGEDTLTAALTMARGNGKTTFVAGLGAAAVFGPLAQPRAECTIVASSLGQARIAFGHSIAFLDQITDTEDRRVWSKSDSAQRAELVHKETGAKLVCRGSDPRRAHGLAPSLALLDEPAQWPPETADRMVAALETAAGKIPDMRTIALGTLPESDDHWFSKWCAGGADYAKVYRAGDDDNPGYKRTWAKANPSIRAMPDLEKVIRRQHQRAKDDDDRMAAFRALRLNQGTPDVSRALLINLEEYKRCVADDLPAKQGPVVYGIDLGTSYAMSAVAAFWPITGRLEVMAAFPDNPGLAERGTFDSVGSLYSRMAERGELITTPGRAVKVPILVAEAMDRFGAPDAVVADHWRDEELIDVLEEAGTPPAAFVGRGMGYKDGADDVRRFRAAIVEQQVKVGRSLLLESALTGAHTISDPAGNAKLAKKGEGDRRQRHKDDAAAAAILAVAEGMRFLGGAPQEQANDGPAGGPEVDPYGGLI